MHPRRYVPANPHPQIPLTPCHDATTASMESAHIGACVGQPDFLWSALSPLLSDAVLVFEGSRLIQANEAAFRLYDLSTAAHEALQAASLPLQQTHADQVEHTLVRSDGSLRVIRARIARNPATPRLWIAVINGNTSADDIHQTLEARNHELKAMARRLFTVQEDERRSISRDLHDDIGQSITAMRMSAHAAMAEPDADRRQDDLQHLLAIADQAASRLRDLSMLLRPPQLDALGLEAALRWQSGIILRNADVVLDLSIQTLSRRPGNETEHACFRIAQEALTNVVRHANATHVSVQLLQLDNSCLALTVSDDGDGFQTGKTSGMGQVVMRERALTAGGSIDVISSPGNGTVIHCILPFDPPQAP